MQAFKKNLPRMGKKSKVGQQRWGNTGALHSSSCAFAHPVALHQPPATPQTEIAQLTAELEARHAKELQDLDAGGGGGAAAVSSDAGNQQAAVASASQPATTGASEVAEEGGDDGGKAGHQTKAMKRRAKQAAAEVLCAVLAFHCPRVDTWVKCSFCSLKQLSAIA